MKAAFAGVTLVCVQSLAAAAVLEVKIDDITWFVTDLNLNDGIVASAVESAFGAPGESFASFSHEPVGAGQRIEELAISGEGTGFRLQTFAGETVSVVSFNSHSYAEPGDDWLLVTPYTAVTVMGNAAVQVSGAYASYEARAGLGMEVRKPDQAQILPSPEPAGTTVSGPVSMTYDNTSSDPVYLLYSDGVSASVTAAPIPEPETFALMTLGLAGVGLAARRRSTATRHLS